MPEYLAPGVYVEEISSGPPPITAVGTTTTGMVGMTRRGPTQGRPQLVTSYGQFVRTFGGAFDFGPNFAAFTDLPYAVHGFFANGGQRLYVSRVVPGSASAATTTLHGGLTTRLIRDLQATATVLSPATLRGIRNGTKIQLRMTKNGITTTSGVLTVSDYDRTTGQVTVGAAACRSRPRTAPLHSRWCRPPASPAPRTQSRCYLPLASTHWLGSRSTSARGEPRRCIARSPRLSVRP